MTSSILASYVLFQPDSPVELADSNGSKFKRFSKMLAAYGDFVDPRGGSEPMKLDKQWAEDIVENAKTGPIKTSNIPVPLGHPSTSAELAEKNKGWMVNLEAREDGLYGIFEIRDSATAEDIEKGLVKDVSVAFDDRYQDKRTSKVFRNVLKHVGLVNDPYIKGMSAMEPVQMSDSAGILFSEGSTGNGSEKNNEMEENTMTAIKNERDFPVEVKYTLDGSETVATIEPGASLEVPEDQVEAVTKQVAEAAKPEDEGEELSDEAKKAKDFADREAAIAKGERELADKKAEASFATLLSEGKVVAAQKEAFLALSSQSNTTVELSDGVKKSVSVLLSEFLDKMPEGLKLSEENGVSGGDRKEDDVELTSEEKSLTDLGLSEEDLKETKKIDEGAK